MCKAIHLILYSDNCLLDYQHSSFLKSGCKWSATCNSFEYSFTSGEHSLYGGGYPCELKSWSRPFRRCVAWRVERCLSKTKLDSRGSPLGDIDVYPVQNHQSHSKFPARPQSALRAFWWKRGALAIGKSGEVLRNLTS